MKDISLLSHLSYLTLLSLIFRINCFQFFLSVSSAIASIFPVSYFIFMYCLSTKCCGKESLAHSLFTLLTLSYQYNYITNFVYINNQSSHCYDNYYLLLNYFSLSNFLILELFDHFSFTRYSYIYVYIFLSLFLYTPLVFYMSIILIFRCSNIPKRDFPGGAVVKNLPASAGDRGSSPGPGRSHMPWSN